MNVYYKDSLKLRTLFRVEVRDLDFDTIKGVAWFEEYPTNEQIMATIYSYQGRTANVKQIYSIDG